VYNEENLNSTEDEFIQYLNKEKEILEGSKYEQAIRTDSGLWKVIKNHLPNKVLENLDIFTAFLRILDEKSIK
jgi:hypothetical protein